jgi:hypothetical protein
MSGEASSPVDVITVPDFTGEAAPRFELRTLLFLGAWVRHQGASRSWPVHLACIGDPPISVRRLAARARASITVHPPMPHPFPPTCNKQRGFEVAPTATRFLLLDTDTLVLRDLAPLADAVGSGIGIGPTTGNHFPAPVWRQVYRSVGVAYPQAAGTCWHASWNLSAHKRISPAYREQCRLMPPYHNGGVVIGRWAHRLGDRWRAHGALIAPLAAEQPPEIRRAFLRHIDQLSLATATAALAQSGVPMIPLPLAYQVRPPLLRAAVVSWSDVALFHYARVLAPYGESVDGISRLLYGRRWHRVRRWLAGRFGLRAVHSPVHRVVDPLTVRTHEGFFEELRQIMRTHVG